MAADTLMEPIVAGILVGGKSLRMGVDKAALPWDGATMLDAVIRIVSEVTPGWVILGASATPPEQTTETIRRLLDDKPGLGPIGGLASLLRANPNRWCLLIACDMPLVTHDVIERLCDERSADVLAVCYHEAGRDEPCCALYHADALPHVERAIAAGQLALHALMRSLPCSRVPCNDPVRTALRNLNTPQDFRNAWTDRPDGRPPLQCE